MDDNDNQQDDQQYYDNQEEEEGQQEMDGEQDDGQEFDEMDLTPFEEDDDETLHRKLVAAKIARKRAEEDLKLLNNRINLLRSEEGRAYKKIDQTRKKAGDIRTQRMRNFDQQREK